MARNSIREYSANELENADIGGVGILGSNAVNNFDNALRTEMAHLKNMNDGTSPIDATFTLCDPTDATKMLTFDVSAVGAGQKRKLIMPDADVNLGALRPTINTSASVTAVAGQRIRCDTSAAAVTITLPETTAEGDTIDIDRIGVNNVVIARNGQTIEGSAADLIIDINKRGVSLVFRGGTWRAYGRAIA